MAPEDRSDQLATLQELVKENRFAMLTSTAAGGELVSRPMTVQEFTDDTFRFITQNTTDVARQSDGREVNLAIVGSSSWVSVSGTGRLNSDVELKKRLWDTFNDVYADGGPENPANVVLEVRATSASYWDSPGGVAQLLSVVKAKVTGDKPDAGEHGTVTL